MLASDYGHRYEVDSDLEHRRATNRVKVEAIEEFLVNLLQECPEGSEEDSDAHRKAYAEFYNRRLMK